MKFLWGLLLVLAFVGIAIGLIFGAIALGVNAVAEAARPALLVVEQIAFWVQALLLVAAAAGSLWAGITTRSVIGLLLWIPATIYAGFIVRDMTVVFWIPGALPSWFPTLIGLVFFVIVFVVAGMNYKGEQYATGAKKPKKA